MHEEFLGRGYHDRVRKMLEVTEEVLPDAVIDSDLNMNTTHWMMSKALKEPFLADEIVVDAGTDALAQDVFLNYLCAVLCPVLDSRTHSSVFGKKCDDFTKKGQLLVFTIKQRKPNEEPETEESMFDKKG